MPPYSPAIIANEFLERSGRDGKPITPMQLLKLVYIAHGWHLADTERPLIGESVEAWKYGPVIPSLFHEFKRFGGGPITKLAYEPVLTDSDSQYPELDIELDAPFLPEEDAATAALIDRIWREYGRKTGWELSTLTHQPNTPWSEAVKSRASAANPVIDTSLIARHYSHLREQRHAG